MTSGKNWAWIRFLVVNPAARFYATDFVNLISFIIVIQRFLYLFCTVYASLLFLIERKSLNHFNKTDKLNKISSIKTWWQD